MLTQHPCMALNNVVISNALFLRGSARVSWKINVKRVTNCLIKIVYSHEHVLPFYIFLESYSVTKAC